MEYTNKLSKRQKEVLAFMKSGGYSVTVFQNGGARINTSYTAHECTFVSPRIIDGLYKKGHLQYMWNHSGNITYYLKVANEG